MKNSPDDARKLIEIFFGEMNSWGKKVIELYKQENGGPQKNEEALRAELKLIFDKFVTIRERKQGRISVMAVSIGAPDYDSQLERISEVKQNGTGFIVETQKSYPHNYAELYRYKIKNSDDGLRIDSKERYSEFGGKWVAGII